MALAETARLIASLELKDLFSKQIGNAEKSLGHFDARLDKSQTRAYRAGAQIGTGIKRTAAIVAGAIGFLGSQVALGLNSLIDLEKVTTQTNAVLKSTKGVAGQTADSVRNLAEKYEGLNAVIDDKVIQSAENVLLTFTAIRKDAFEPALKAALDMSTALGTDLQGSVIQIGKALQDPIKGITALRRVGVNFSADQVKVIKRLVETGKTLEAQKLILAELNTEFGGSFLAQGNTTAGKVAKFKDAIEDLQKALATALLPTIGKVSDAASKFLADPKVVAEVGKLGEKIASLFSDKNLAEGGKFLQDAFNTAKQAAPIIEASARATFGIVQAAVGLFKSLPEGLQQLAVGAFAINKLTGGLVTNVAGGLFDTVKDLIIKQRGTTPLNPLFVSDVTGGLAGLAGKAAVGVGAAEVAGAATGAAGLGLGTITAGVAAGTAVAALGIMGLGWLIQATSTPEQMAQTAANALASEKFKHSFGKIPYDNGHPLPVAITSGNTTTIAGAISTALQPLLRFGPKTINAQTGFTVPNTNPLAGKEKDDRDIVKATLRVIGNEFKNIANTLKNSNKPSEIKNAIAEAMKLIGSGRGNASATEKVLSGLKSALKNTHDPKLQESLRNAIGKVEKVLPGRQFAAKQLAKADRILRSNEATGRKINDLKAIEKALKDRGLPAAAKSITAKIDQAKREQTYASRATTQAIKDKDMSPRITIPITNRISVGDIVKTQTTFGKFGKFQS